MISLLLVSALFLRGHKGLEPLDVQGNRRVLRREQGVEIVRRKDVAKPAAVIGKGGDFRGCICCLESGVRGCDDLGPQLERYPASFRGRHRFSFKMAPVRTLCTRAWYTEPDKRQACYTHRCLCRVNDIACRLAHLPQKLSGLIHQERQARSCSSSSSRSIAATAARRTDCSTTGETAAGVILRSRPSSFAASVAAGREDVAEGTGKDKRAPMGRARVTVFKCRAPGKKS